jgi:hypothetical protein
MSPPPRISSRPVTPVGRRVGRSFVIVATSRYQCHLKPVQNGGFLSYTGIMSLR